MNSRLHQRPRGGGGGDAYSSSSSGGRDRRGGGGGGGEMKKMLGGGEEEYEEGEWSSEGRFFSSHQGGREGEGEGGDDLDDNDEERHTSHEHVGYGCSRQFSDGAGGIRSTRGGMISPGGGSSSSSRRNSLEEGELPEEGEIEEEEEEEEEEGEVSDDNDFATSSSKTKISSHQEAQSGGVFYDEGSHHSSLTSTSSSHDHLGYKGRRAGKPEVITAYDHSVRDRDFPPAPFPPHNQNSQADLLSPPYLPSTSSVTSSLSKRGAGGGGRSHSETSSLAGGGGGSLLGMPFAFPRHPPPPSVPSGVSTAGGTGSFPNFLGGSYHPNATGSMSSDSSLHRRGGEEGFPHGIAGSAPTGTSLEAKGHQGRASSLAPSSSSVHRGSSSTNNNNNSAHHHHHSQPPAPAVPKEVCMQFPAARSSNGTD